MGCTEFIYWRLEDPYGACYFSGYITRIHFVGQKAIDKMHKSMAHRGRVISASMGEESFDFSLKATSNPRLTARILLACARAVWRMK